MKRECAYFAEVCLEWNTVKLASSSSPFCAGSPFPYSETQTVLLVDVTESMYAQLTVLEVLLTFATNLRVSILNQLELENSLEKLVKELSDHEKSMLCAAVCLMTVHGRAVFYMSLVPVIKRPKMVSYVSQLRCFHSSSKFAIVNVRPRRISISSLLRTVRKKWFAFQFLKKISRLRYRCSLLLLTTEYEEVNALMGSVAVVIDGKLMSCGNGAQVSRDLGG